jgi:DNA-directed RNA polymerase specialized sigma24 family protein
MNSPEFDSPKSISDSSTPQRSKERWSLNQEAFDRLLRSLSVDRDEAGARYEIIRRKLVRFFECRSVEDSEDHADETINRVARRIYEGQQIDNVTGYSYGVARLVLMEVIKERERAPIGLDEAPGVFQRKSVDETDSEPRMKCFDECLESLPPESRQLIIDYYQEERRAKIELRQQLADQLRIPVNALRIRAHRIRMSLERCITTCMQAPADV